MRKWILIVLIAVVAIGICAYVLLQPRRGSVEYHKREFLKAATGNGGMVEHFILSRGPTVVQNAYWNQRDKHREFHHQALIEDGYLTTRTFFLSNYASHYVAGWATDALRLEPDGRDIMMFTRLGGNGRYKLVVTAPAEVMGKIEELVRQIDAAEIKK